MIYHSWEWLLRALRGRGVVVVVLVVVVGVGGNLCIRFIHMIKCLLHGGSTAM